MLQVPTKCRSAAGLDGAHHLELCAWQRVRLAVRLAIDAEDISQLRTAFTSCRLLLLSRRHAPEIRYGNGLLSGVESRSSRSWGAAGFRTCR